MDVRCGGIRSYIAVRSNWIAGWALLEEETERGEDITLDRREELNNPSSLLLHWKVMSIIVLSALVST